MFQRHFQCGNSFSRFFFDSEKGGKSGSQAAPTVADLTQKVTDLEAQKTRLEGELQTAKDATAAETLKVTNLTADKTRLEGELQTAKDATAAETLKVTDLTAEKTRLEGELQTSKAAKDKAEADLKTADDRAETKLYEISARNGGTLPPKKAGAGDHTQDQTKSDATPRQKLAGIFKVA